MAAEGRRIRYLCMPGSPFTGSTLLGSLLNEHPACASIGAATGLIRSVDLATYRCSCGILFRDCEFWRDIAERTRALGHPVDVFETGFWNTHLRLSDNRVVNALLVRPLPWDQLNEVRDAVSTRVPPIASAISRAGWNSWSLAAAVLDSTGKKVFVDTARDHQRPKYLGNNRLLDLKVIHLIRDVRGTAASIMKYTGADVATAARRWKHYNAEAARVSRYIAPDSWMSLHYEDLCTDPAGVLDRISDFLEVDRVTLELRQDVRRHIIGNSAMRLKGLAEIREDRSWENRFDASDLAVIAGIAGATSHTLGYEWP